jgi:hypothetical protein
LAGAAASRGEQVDLEHAVDCGAGGSTAVTFHRPSTPDCGETFAQRSLKVLKPRLSNCQRLDASAHAEPLVGRASTEGLLDQIRLAVK